MCFHSFPDSPPKEYHCHRDSRVRKGHTSCQKSALGTALLYILLSPRRERQKIWGQASSYHRGTNQRPHTESKDPSNQMVQSRPPMKHKGRQGSQDPNLCFLSGCLNSIFENILFQVYKAQTTLQCPNNFLLGCRNKVTPLWIW